MKQSYGFSRLWPSVGTLTFMGGSFVLRVLAAPLMAGGLVLMKLASAP